ncbi:MAG: ATP synthase subunit I [Lentisphaeria bacterium]|nr:ATP synthase subunit I [Candidatus Neomarinimicrobiota bacterium]MCF7842438.1 ATP synthase subunit I [Lentisphaeria bacterium]
MNPALKILVPAALVNGLVIVGLFITNRAAWAVAILAGALLPVAISAVSLWLFSRQKRLTFKKAQAFMLYSFMAKILLIGLWVVIMATSENVELLPFISSLLINFLAWHLSEAYHIRPLLEQVVSENLESE